MFFISDEYVLPVLVVVTFGMFIPSIGFYAWKILKK